MSFIYRLSLLVLLISVFVGVFIRLTPIPVVEGGGPRVGSGAFFDPVASRYDVMNRVISVGLDGYWRREMARSLELGLDGGRGSGERGPGHVRVLDVATGTGESAMAVLDEWGARLAQGNLEVEVVGVDPSKAMLEVGRKKVEGRGYGKRVRLVEGTAEELDFEDGEFDGVVVAFGVRNFENRERGLREMARVVKRGGRVVILEASEPEGTWFAPVAKLFIHQVIPRIAVALVEKPAAYKYLGDSLRVFPNATVFSQMIESSGLKLLSHRRLPLLSAGPNIYVAWRPA